MDGVVFLEKDREGRTTDVFPEEGVRVICRKMSLLVVSLSAVLCTHHSYAIEPEAKASIVKQVESPDVRMVSYDHENKPIASVPLVVVNKHEAYLPVAAICGAKSIQVLSGKGLEVHEIETITVWPDAQLCKIKVRGIGFSGEFPKQRLDNLKLGTRLSVLPEFDLNISTAHGVVVSKVSVAGPAIYLTSIPVVATKPGGMVYDEVGNLAGYVIEKLYSEESKNYLIIQSLPLADTKNDIRMVYEPAQWYALQVHADDGSAVRAIYSDGLLSLDRLSNLKQLVKESDGKLDISNHAFIKCMSVIYSESAWELGESLTAAVLRIHPESENALFEAATVQLRTNRNDMAVESFKATVGSKDTVIAQQSMYFSGYCYLSEGKVNAGTSILEKLIAINPKHVSALAMLGTHYLYVKDADNLDRIARNLVAVDWSKRELLKQAVGLGQMGRRGSAVKIMDELLNRWPTDADLRAAVTSQYDEYGMNARVLEIVRAGVQSESATTKDWFLVYVYEQRYRDPNLPQTVENWQARTPSSVAYITPATMMFVNNENQEEALKILERGYKLYSLDLEYTMFYCLALIQCDEQLLATKVTEQAIKDFPNEPMVKVLHASALVANRQIGLAKQVCEEVLVTVPDDPDALFVMAQIYMFLGEKDNCDKMIFRIKSLPPAKVRDLREKWKNHSSVKLLS